MAKQLQKLELTWIGKGKEPKLEPRILLEDTSKSFGDAKTENMLINGDNLLALRALEQFFIGTIKCVCIDPPYNTGSAFDHYDDGIEHSIWLGLMHDRLKILYSLLTKDGSIWIYIDDNEVHYLKVMCDELFGRENFIATICVKMSHLSGVKMSHADKKPPKIKEYILVYAKNKEHFSLKPAYEKVNWDDALDRYSQFIINKEEPIENWKVIPVRQAAIQAKVNIKDKEEYEVFLIDNAEKIFRTARNRALETTGIRNKFTEIVSKRGLNKLIYNDEEVLFASEKMTEVDGKLLPVNILGDIWLDIGINNLHNEGGVEFRNGKKPEKAIHRIIEMATNPNDWVLDSFLGSGTTGAVAHKMKRRWIGIELGEHATTHAIPRLQKVITGEDTGGVSKAVEWKGGGGFKFYTLAPSLIQKDKYGNDIINPTYNANMLAAAMAKQEGFRYLPHESTYWKQGNSTEKDYIFTTTQFITVEMIDRLAEEMQPNESLLVCCKGFAAACKSRHSNITIKKIPQMLFGRCEFGKDDYSLNIVNLPHDESNNVTDEDEISIEETTGKKSKTKSKKKADDEKQSSLF